MNQNGKLRICDRCGAQHFSKTTGEGETDGGYTRWNNFEEPPRMWGFYEVGVESINDTRTRKISAELCTACAEKWNAMMAKFMQNVEEPQK